MVSEWCVLRVKRFAGNHIGYFGRFPDATNMGNVQLSVILSYNTAGLSRLKTDQVRTYIEKIRTTLKKYDLAKT